MSSLASRPTMRAFALATAVAALLLVGGLSSAEARGTGCGKTGVASKRSDRVRVTDIRDAVRCLINEERTANNLRLSGALNEAAQRHSRYMFRHRCFSHRCPGEADTTSRIRAAGYMSGSSSWRVGEVIALNRDTASPREVVRQWKNSPGHRSQILSSGYKHLGVGVVARKGRAYYTVTLGWRSG